MDGIEFELHRSESIGFLGPDGAGKSTTMRMIAATSPRTGGELTVPGLDPRTHGSEIRSRLGVVPQDDALDEAIVPIPLSAVDIAVGEVASAVVNGLLTSIGFLAAATAADRGAAAVSEHRADPRAGPGPLPGV